MTCFRLPLARFLPFTFLIIGGNTVLFVVEGEVYERLEVVTWKSLDIEDSRGRDEACTDIESIVKRSVGDAGSV